MKQRQSNFECLRIISILLIISFHYCFKGGFNFPADQCSFNKILVDIFYHFGELGVNCFILISGYFFDKATFKWKKVALLLLETEFYIIICRLFLVLAGINSWNQWKWKVYLLPVLGESYWFVTVYVLIYIFSPFIKKLIMALSQKEFRNLIIISILIWSVFPTIVLGIAGGNNTETMPYYNRFIWLMIIYCMGAYIKMYGFEIIKDMGKSVTLFLVTSFSIFAFILINEYRLLPLGNKPAYYFWPPNSILQLMLSISLFAIFYHLKIAYHKWINYIASCTLGIYMLHDGVLQNYFWNDLYQNATHQNSRFLIVHISIAVVTIFILGVLIESIRKRMEIILGKLFSHAICLWNSFYYKQ